MLRYLEKEETRIDLVEYLSELEFINKKEQIEKLEKFSETPRLYKYSSINKFIIGDLKSNELTATTPYEFNDLYDSYLFTNSEQQEKKEIDKTNKLLQKCKVDLLPIDFNKKLKKQCQKKDEHLSSYFNNEFFICCLSSLKDDILMWSHYADNNKGICIEYDFSNNKLSNCIYPVIYTEKPIVLTDLYYEKEQIRLTILISIINKYKDWRSEQEWRVIWYYPQNNNANEKRIKILPPKPKCIYIGKEFINNFKEVKNPIKIDDEEKLKAKKKEADLIKSFLDYVKERKIPLKIAKQKTNDYKLYFNDITVEEIKNVVE